MVVCICQNLHSHTLKRVIFLHGNYSSTKRIVGNHWRVFGGGITLSDLCFQRIALAGEWREWKWEPSEKSLVDPVRVKNDAEEFGSGAAGG